MKGKISHIKFFSLTLIVCYLFFLAVSAHGSRVKGDEERYLVLAGLFAVMLVPAFFVLRLKNWARVSLIGLNALMAFYLLWPSLQYMMADGILISYLMLNLLAVIFYHQSSIKSFFVSPEAALAAASGESSAPEGKTETPLVFQSVLVIDDDETVIRTVRPILMKQGYSVLTSNSGEEGLQIARSQKPDLIILDVILPGIKGRDICKRLKQDELTKDIPVVFLTAKYSPDDIRAEMEAGGQAHLTKPVNPKSLLSTVRDILDSLKKQKKR